VQRRPVEAEPLLRRGLALRQRTEPDAWTTFHTRWLLGAVLLVQRSDPEADRFLREGYEGLVQRAATISTDGKARLTDTGARVARLLASWGRNRDAAKWRRETAAVATSVPEAGTR
jgi:hypothetical protein